jgi:ribosomal protein L11 methyltransferase
VIRLAVRVRRADAEVVLAELLELAPSGLEERDVAGDVVEYAVYGAPGELPALPDVRAAAGAALVDVVTEQLADDWHERWRQFHRPVELGPPGRRLHVRPPWTPAPAPAPGVLDVVIEPGQAFGTGAHPTTRLCLELLLERPARGALADVGCGSGVLAIAAAKLGFAPVRALDHDDEAVCATRANAATNGVAVDVVRHDVLRDGPAPGAPTVVANLLRPLLLRIAAAGFGGDTTPRALIAGGLLEGEAAEVARAFAACGLAERERRAEGGWAALLLERP